MMKFFLSNLIMLISFFMFFTNNPLSMGLFILIQTLLTCILSGMMINTYWFSYILFLIFLGGLLVLFIYVSSIASNELFKISIFNKILMLLSIIFLFMLSFYFKNNLYWMNLYFNDEMLNFFNLFLFSNNEYNFNLAKLYNEQTYFLMMMLIIYLFITLIAVVKITNIFFGPLRSIM
uniref:NADH-ubiquinone oxidoreductase chain 6 n=1 Tax=Heliconius pachinus TaxID=33428 RepID=A0A0U1X0X9_9NEOP|nr:NADH dehydrogenase subunit 6 [Heliconius pachinus]AIJ02034.1 NADH dehydrogenase subunit 6 [Heliconius pachinus]